MGSRPRLSADAAFAAYWNPRAGTRGIITKIPVPRQCCDFGESGSRRANALAPRAAAAYAAQL